METHLPNNLWDDGTHMLAVYPDSILLVFSIMCGNMGGGHKNNRYMWNDEETKLFLELDENTLNSIFHFLLNFQNILVTLRCKAG